MRHDIADSDRITPIERLCRQMLREGLEEGIASVELVGAGSLPAVNRCRDGQWMPYLQLPRPAFSALIDHLEQMAGSLPGGLVAAGTIQVEFAGQDAEIRVEGRRGSDGMMVLTLAFPAAAAIA